MVHTLQKVLDSQDNNWLQKAKFSSLDTKMKTYAQIFINSIMCIRPYSEFHYPRQIPLSSTRWACKYLGKNMFLNG